MNFYIAVLILKMKEKKQYFSILGWPLSFLGFPGGASGVSAPVMRGSRTSCRVRLTSVQWVLRSGGANGGLKWEGAPSDSGPGDSLDPSCVAQPSAPKPLQEAPEGGVQPVSVTHSTPYPAAYTPALEAVGGGCDAICCRHG